LVYLPACLYFSLQHLLQQHSYPYPPSIDESSNKSDRRSFVGRACNSVTNVCCARPPTDTQGGYYEDDFNNESWECTFGTTDQDGIWVNNSDKVGTIMSSLVWVLFIYSCLTITLLAQHNHLKNRIAMVYITICALALASHAKTSFTDPGSIPREAVPPASLFKRGITTHSMCSHCQVSGSSFTPFTLWQSLTRCVSLDPVRRTNLQTRIIVGFVIDVSVRWTITVHG
jgi:hypothetical protein